MSRGLLRNAWLALNGYRLSDSHKWSVAQWIRAGCSRYQWQGCLRVRIPSRALLAAWMQWLPLYVPLMSPKKDETVDCLGLSIKAASHRVGLFSSLT